MHQRAFKLAPGVELVRLAADRFTLRSEFDAYELSGEAATDFVETVLVELSRPLTIDEITARLPSYSSESVHNQIDLLISHGLVVEDNRTSVAGHGPLSAFLEAANLDIGESIELLRSVRVGIFGLEAHGAHLAKMLVRIGVGTIRLVDPFPYEQQHFDIAHPGGVRGNGQSLQDATAAALGGGGSTIETGVDASKLDPSAIRALVDGCNLVVGCWDQAFGAATHWLNQAALDAGVPALFSELHATKTLAGPLYLPHRSACWMCYRMRSIASAPDFEQAMAFEEHLDRARSPRLASRPMLPFLPEALATSLALETLRLFLGLSQPILVETIIEFDALSGTTEFHPVLAAPSCPVCSKKNASRQPSVEELMADHNGSSELGMPYERLVDAKTGIISQFSAVPRDTSEVPIPLVWRAKVANHRFFATYDEERATCSGKGMTLEQAWSSCLGEAIERYSAACWSEDDLVIAARRDLEGQSVDPRDLVLFAEDQYASLPYVPYQDDATLAWVRGRSLTGGDELWIPAIAVLMDYPVRTEGEFLFGITSNGLAAGPTLRDAVLGAMLEVLERDAVLISWYNSLPGHPYNPATHPDAAVRQLFQLYARRGVELALVEVATDHPARVFMGMALQTDCTTGPAAVVGLGADLDPTVAARKAAMEVGQVRPSIRRRARFSQERMEALTAHPEIVETMEDHALLYAHPSATDSLQFLFGEPRDWARNGTSDSKESLQILIDHFRAIGQEVAFVDLTPSDMRGLGVYTARVVVPGFQPISFGSSERRLGGRRLFEFPVSAGLRTAPLQGTELNPMPHPVA